MSKCIQPYYYTFPFFIITVRAVSTPNVNILFISTLIKSMGPYSVHDPPQGLFNVTAPVIS